jgi:LPXTG-site transpeptidase (sortase) family protein
MPTTGIRCSFGAMKADRQKTFVALCMVGIGAGLFVSTAAQAFLFAPLKDLGVEAPHLERAEWLPPEKGPALLSIPAIKLEAPIAHTGITSRGTMAVPVSYSQVGWYRYGTAPGQQGSAVMAGHVDNGAGLSAVFADLEALKRGDEIIVETAEGERIRFAVEGVRQYPYQEVPEEEIFGRADEARLNLITCAGEWLAEKETYSERLVVYAVRVA